MKQLDRKTIWGIVLTLLLISMLPMALNIQSARAQDPLPSSISIDVDPILVVVGYNVTIKGAINETVPDDTSVYIEYSNFTKSNWNLLAKVNTTNSQYEYNWTTDVGLLWPPTNKYGWWDVRARWEGDANYLPATSTVKTVRVVKVKIFGDVNGDVKVDGKDIAVVGVAFGSYPGHPRWNPQADLNQGNKIEGKDIAKVAKNFGKTYP